MSIRPETEEKAAALFDSDEAETALPQGIPYFGALPAPIPTERRGRLLA